MFSLNRVHIIGYQTQPVTVRKTPGGTSVTDLNVVVPYSFKSESGEMLSGKSFHTVTVWGALADVAQQFVRTGSQLFIGGRLQTDSWDDATSGEKRSKTKIVASEMILVDPKNGQQSEPAGAQLITHACNKADLIGNVTRDPEMRTTTSGQRVLTLGVATNERWKDKATGEMKDKPEFHNVVVWGQLADEVSKFVKKGSKVFVSGRIQTRSWETQAGGKRTTTEVIAEQLSLLGIKNSAAGETFQAEGSSRSSDFGIEPASSFNQDAGPKAATFAAVPEINYESEIKVEDLPF